ncbi:hypothetical protein B0I35DRAFT_408684 [Stachybotrys elegans]|uniref:Uncharacterized protein n=1 Tax=Stachybotrys elegans TaxID=80388 RepID=A0A8K0SRF5_9HYPO|nr:hypothetical protein B0I35DRAFT_408684 [Stachybotrys elegans]
MAARYPNNFIERTVTHSGSDSTPELSVVDFTFAEEFSKLLEPEPAVRDRIDQIYADMSFLDEDVKRILLKDEIDHAYPTYPVPRPSNITNGLTPSGSVWPTRAVNEEHRSNLCRAEGFFAQEGSGMMIEHRRIFISLLSRLYVPSFITPLNHYILRYWADDTSYSRILLLSILYHDYSDEMDSIMAMARLAYPGWDRMNDCIPRDQKPVSMIKKRGAQSEVEPAESQYADAFFYRK